MNQERREVECEGCGSPVVLEQVPESASGFDIAIAVLPAVI